MEARARILDGLRQLPAREVTLAEAINCFAAVQYRAVVPLPAFDNSAMDGYAVGFGDRSKGARLRVAGEQPAGLDRKLRVGPGEAIRIFTGAPIPAGTDAVVMQEDVSRDGDDIVLNTEVETGEFIRRRACDLAEGQEIAALGQRIRPTLAALFASQGLAEVNIGGKVEASVISTGDEIVAQGKGTKPGQIFDSNSVLLSTMLREMGTTVSSATHCSDNEPALAESIRRGAASHVLILTGGVSVGQHDLVQSVIRSLGGTIEIWRVAIKPGKPFLFGHIGECAVFGLPGNPVSAFVTFLRFVRPGILKMMGANAREQEPRGVRARLDHDLVNDGDRAHYIRGKYEAGVFVPVGRQESHALFGLSRANAMTRLAPGTHFQAGTMLDLELWD